MIFLKSFLVVVLLASAFPTMSIWPLAFLSFALLVDGLMDPKLSAKQMALFFGSFAFFCNLIGFYWISYTITEFANFPWAASIPMTAGLYVILSLFSLFMGFLWFHARKRLPSKLWVQVLAVWVFLILWDWGDIRMFPWAPVMSMGGNDYLLASVNVIDTWGWRVLFPLLGILVWLLFQKSLLPKWRIASGATFLVLLSGTMLIGHQRREKIKAEHPFGQPVVMLQGNVGNYQKRMSESGEEPTVRNVLGIYRDLIEEAGILLSDRVVNEGIEPWFAWPETAFPGFPLRDRHMQRQLDFWVNLSRGLHLVGAYEDGTMMFKGKEKDTEYNIALLVHERQGYVNHYRKMELMPFGEYFPFDNILPQVYDWVPEINHFGRGEGPHFLAHPDPDGAVFLPVICYEILFDEIMDSFMKVAKEKHPGRQVVIYNPTNDSWYGRSIQPFMHGRLAQWQAARVGAGLIRATNTGISMLVAPWGEILQEGPLFEIANVVGELPVKRLQLRMPRIEVE